MKWDLIKNFILYCKFEEAELSYPVIKNNFNTMKELCQVLNSMAKYKL